MNSEDFKLDIEKFGAQKKEILLAIAAGNTYAKTAQIVDLAESTIYKWLKEDPEFKRYCHEAREQSVEICEQVLVACAQKAFSDPRYQTSLIFLLKSRKREVYGDRVEQVLDVKTDEIKNDLQDMLRSVRGGH
jgi:hypothetical protein